MDDRAVESTGTPPQYSMVESWLAAGNRLERAVGVIAFATGVRPAYLSQEDVEQLIRSRPYRFWSPINSAALVAFDTDLCLVEPCSSALRAPARFREFLFVEG